MIIFDLAIAAFVVGSSVASLQNDSIVTNDMEFIQVVTRCVLNIELTLAWTCNYNVVKVCGMKIAGA